MNGFQENPQVSSGGEIGELREEVQALRSWLCAALIMIIVFGFSANLFLFKQVRMVGNEVNTANDAIKNFNTPKAIDFWNRLVQYSHQHPDFAPIVSKYGPYLNQTFLGNPPVKQ
jgi:hypothetical protein